MTQAGEPSDAALLSALAALADRRSLGRQEAREALRAIMAGVCTPAQIGAFLMALRVKGDVGCLALRVDVPTVDSVALIGAAPNVHQEQGV